jgi:hypothetical protein
MPGEETKSPMSPAQVRAEIERTREQLATSVLALREEVAVATDWRLWVQRRPVLCLSTAFAIGFLIGSRR